jgi:predicted enzyme related to lactoylglutathione lyase
MDRDFPRFGVRARPASDRRHRAVDHIQTTSSMSNPIVFFEITCRDAAALAPFYENVFGWSVKRGEGDAYRTVTTGGTIDGMITEIPDEVRASLTVFVHSDDMDATIAAAEKNGGALLFPPMELPNGDRVAMLTDPAGTTIGVIQAGA